MSTLHTRTTQAWIARHSDTTLAEVLAGKKLDSLNYTDADMSSYGWVLIGEAQIAVSISEEKTLVTRKINALQEEIAETKAQAEVRIRVLEDQVKNLLAIAYEKQEG